MVTGGGAAVVAARGRKHGGTVGAGRLATGGSKPIGILTGGVSEERYLQW
jgi:hypothetical protein